MKSHYYFYTVLGAIALLYLADSVLCGGEEEAGLFKQQANDARLAKTVTLSLQGASLEEGLEEMGKQTGVSLISSRTCEDQKVQIYVQEIPLIEVMGALEELMPGRWRVEKTDSVKARYRFRMDDEALKKRKAWWEDTAVLKKAAEEMQKEYQREHLDEYMRLNLDVKPSEEEPTDFDITPLARQTAKTLLGMPDQYREMLIQQSRTLQGGGYARPPRPEAWMPVSGLPQEAQNALVDLVPVYNDVMGEHIGKIDLSTSGSQAVEESFFGFTNTNGKITLFLKGPGFQREMEAIL